MTIVVVDASLVVAALIEVSDTGRWAETLLRSEELAAPHLMPVEVAHVLRRASLDGHLDPELTSMAHAELLDLSVELFAYAPLAERTWDLRSTVTSYDAWYVALAESLDVSLATLDHRLSRAPGPTCEFLLPPP